MVKDYTEEELTEEYKTSGKTVEEFVEELKQREGTFEGSPFEEELDIIRDFLEEVQTEAEEDPVEKELKLRLQREVRNIITRGIITSAFFNNERLTQDKFLNEPLTAEGLVVSKVGTGQPDKLEDDIPFVLKKITKVKRDVNNHIDDFEEDKKEGAELPSYAKVLRQNLIILESNLKSRSKSSITSTRKPITRQNKIPLSAIQSIFNQTGGLVNIDMRTGLYNFWYEIDKELASEYADAVKEFRTSLSANLDTYAKEIRESIQFVREYARTLGYEGVETFDGIKDKMKEEKEKIEAKKKQSLIDKERVEELNKLILTFEKDQLPFIDNIKELIGILEEYENSGVMNYLHDVEPNTSRDIMTPLKSIQGNLKFMINNLEDKIGARGKDRYGFTEGGQRTFQDATEEAEVEEEKQKLSEADVKNIAGGVKSEYDEFDLLVRTRGVDPFLAYLNEKRDAIITLDENIRENIIEKLKESRRAVFFDNRALDKLDEMIDDVTESIFVAPPDNENYQIPFFYVRDSTFSKSLDPSVRSQMKSKDEKFQKIIEKLNESLVKIFQFTPKVVAGRPSLEGGNPVGGTFNPQAGDKKRRELSQRQARSKGTKGASRIRLGLLEADLKQLNKDVKKFAEVYDKFMIQPFRTSSNVIVRPRHIIGIASTILEYATLDVDSEDIFSGKSPSPLTQLRTGNIELLSVSQITQAKDFFNYVFKSRTSDNMGNVENLAKTFDGVVRALANVATPNFTKEEVRNQLSKIIYSTTASEKIRNALAEVNVSGKTIKERAEKDSSGADSVVTSLRAYISEVRPEYGEKRGGKDLKELYAILNQLADKLDLPLVVKMLETHDTIRKMLGKKVVYNHYPLQFESIDYFLDSSKYDLTHLEVENIVKSLDAHNNISTSYGITTEDVYLIKANFR